MGLSIRLIGVEWIRGTLLWGMGKIMLLLLKLVRRNLLLSKDLKIRELCLGFLGIAKAMNLLPDVRMEP